MTFAVKPIALGAAIFTLASLAPATSFITTKLRDLAAITSAVVQGELVREAILVDADGVPWTIYTIAVEMMLAGEFKDKEFSFRCVGGRVGDQGLSLVSAPQLALGDSVVVFYTEGDRTCQVAGLEHGVFWRRSNAAGEQRLVNFEGRAIASIGAEGPVFSGEKIVSSAPNTPEQVAAAHSEPTPAEEEERAASLPPPAAAATLLDELVAFSATHVTRPRTVVSTNDLSGAPRMASEGNVRK